MDQTISITIERAYDMVIKRMCPKGFWGNKIHN
jgi:hypothetical protein